MIFRFVVRGIIIYINNLYSIGYLVISDMFGNSYDFDMNELFMYLGSMLEKEVVFKQTMVVELKIYVVGSLLRMERILEFVDIIFDFCVFDLENLNDYVKNLVREVMY